MYGEGYPARGAAEVEHVSDGVYVWVDPEEYGLGHERYGERPPTETQGNQTDQAQVADGGTSYPIEGVQT